MPNTCHLDWCNSSEPQRGHLMYAVKPRPPAGRYYIGDIWEWGKCPVCETEELTLIKQPLEINTTQDKHLVFDLSIALLPICPYPDSQTIKIEYWDYDYTVICGNGHTFFHGKDYWNHLEMTAENCGWSHERFYGNGGVAVLERLIKFSPPGEAGWPRWNIWFSATNTIGRGFSIYAIWTGN